MKLYTGSAPCPGCGRTGEEITRDSKDSLCPECNMALELGQALVKERNLTRIHHSLDDLKVGYMTWYAIHLDEVDKKLRELLKTFSKFDHKYATGINWSDGCLCGHFDSITSRDMFVLPEPTFEAAKDLCQTLHSICRQIEEVRDNYRKELDQELAEQKNDIYNQGVEYGRNLLFQLNEGKITLDDFTKRINKY